MASGAPRVGPRATAADSTSQATRSSAAVNAAPDTTDSPYRPDRTAGHELGVAREILAGILRGIPSKYLEPDVDVSSLVSCQSLAALHRTLTSAAAKLDLESLLTDAELRAAFVDLPVHARSVRNAGGAR